MTDEAKHALFIEIARILSEAPNEPGDDDDLPMYEPLEGGDTHAIFIQRQTE